MLPCFRDEEVEPDPIQNAGSDQCPSHGWGSEPWDIVSRRGGCSAGWAYPGGHNGKEIGNGEEEGGGGTNVRVYHGFLAPFPSPGDAKEQQARTNYGAKEGVDAVAVYANKNHVRSISVPLCSRG